ncbi:MAG TPA: GNAT family N-acetyltransferase, partial [Candidatus Kapabacteria bacterium]|nr:GNAT family N-acetyltransferase [Candidatus Kapabacteria bacterium]
MGKNKLIIIDADRNSAPLLNNFYIDSAYAAIDKLSYEYPNFGKWYYEKIVPGLFSGERKILVNLIDNTISAVAILKDTADERKICTIRVHPLFRRQGVGKMLIGKSFELLGTDKPI